jgi:hypothetical protein
MSYLLFGFSLLVTCMAAASITVWVSRFQVLWQRFLSGLCAGTASGALFGAYVALRIFQDGAAISAERDYFAAFVVAGVIAGVILGCVLLSLWRLARWWATMVWLGLAEPFMRANGDQAARPRF